MCCAMMRVASKLLSKEARIFSIKEGPPVEAPTRMIFLGSKDFKFAIELFCHRVEVLSRRGDLLYAARICAR